MPDQLMESYWPAHTGEPVRDLTLGALLRDAAAAEPDRLALVDGVADAGARREWTYAELLADAERAARALLARFDPGDRIGVWAPNSADWIVLQQGISLAGMIMVAANPAYRARELEYVLSQSGAVGLFYVDSYRGGDLAAIVEEVRPSLSALAVAVTFSEWAKFLDSGDPEQALPEVAPNDPIQIQYTSGTTGFPKGALLHHKGLVNEAHFVALRAGMADGDVYVNAMPMYHIGGGAVTSFGAVAMHGTFVIMPSFDAGLTLELFETLSRHARAARSHDAGRRPRPPRLGRAAICRVFKTIMSGASAVSGQRWSPRTIELLGCQFSILFGQTEMHGVISQTRVTDSPIDQAETVGQPLPQLEVKIADPDTGEVRPHRASRARSAAAATRTCSATTRCPRPPRTPSTTTAGCTWATSARWTTAASCGSPAGSRT